MGASAERPSERTLPRELPPRPVRSSLAGWGEFCTGAGRRAGRASCTQPASRPMGSRSNQQLETCARTRRRGSQAESCAAPAPPAPYPPNHLRHTMRLELGEFTGAGFAQMQTCGVPPRWCGRARRSMPCELSALPSSFWGLAELTGFDDISVCCHRPVSRLHSPSMDARRLLPPLLSPPAAARPAGTSSR